MDISWQTFGHNQTKNILEKQLVSGKFPHAYLFAGPEGVGKKTLALEFAGKILELEKNQASLRTHPDFSILDQEAEITVEAILDFISKLAFRPFLGQKKVAVINNAELLNTQSGNALLKTLEEPSQSTIIILVAGPGKILPTIVSRCCCLRFNVFSERQMEAFAGRQNLQVNAEIIDLSFGRISRLKALAADKAFFSNQQFLVENYINFSKMSVGEKMLAINKYAEQDSGELEKNFLVWLNYQTQDLSRQPLAYTKLQALSDSLLGLQMNKNKKLILQSLFLQI